MCLSTKKGVTQGVRLSAVLTNPLEFNAPLVSFVKACSIAAILTEVNWHSSKTRQECMINIGPNYTYLAEEFGQGSFTRIHSPDRPVCYSRGGTARTLAKRTLAGLVRSLGTLN